MTTARAHAAIALALAASASAVAGFARAEAPAPASPAAADPIVPVLPIAHPAPPEPALSEMRLDRSLGRYVAPYGNGKAILTLDPHLQQQLERTLAGWTVPWGATVLLDPRSR